MATRQLLAVLAQLFAQQSGQRIAMESVGGVHAVKRVQSKEVFDVVILGSDAIDMLVTSGHLVTGSRVDIVRSPIAMAAKRGSTCADITTAASLKNALLAAPSISYSTGPSGVYLAQLFDSMGIAEQLKNKTVQAPPGVPVGSLVAQGQAALGFQQRCELIDLPGIDILGDLPEELAHLTTFSAGIPANAPVINRAVVQDFLRFTNSAQAIALKQAQGMSPIESQAFKGGKSQ